MSPYYTRLNKIEPNREHPPMSYTVTKVDIWSSKIEDKPGSLAKVLGTLGNAGANLDCVIARRDAAKSGSGVVFLTPVKGAATRKAAQSAGLALARNIATLKGQDYHCPCPMSQLGACTGILRPGINGVVGQTAGKNATGLVTICKRQRDGRWKYLGT
jgi:hypothetical protein